MNNNVLGILNFEPSYVNVEGVGNSRPISAASILGRYRVSDFMMSNLSNSGIDNIKVLIKEKPRSIVEHMKSANYNINSKSGRIQLLFGESAAASDLYNVDIAAFKAYMGFIEERKPEYVVVAPNHFLFIQDFSEMLNYHIKSKNDVTMLYHHSRHADKHHIMCDALDLNKSGRVLKIYKNRSVRKVENISLETYVMGIDVFKQLVKEAEEVSSLYTLSDIIQDSVKELRVGTFPHHGYVSCISTLDEYYYCNMSVRKDINKLINDSWPIYTMTNDSCPTLYTETARCSGSLIANGCLIEGTVIDSVVSRNVTVKKGAVVKNSILLPDVVIDSDCKMDYAIIDRLAKISQTKELIGKQDKPIYVKRGDHI